MQKILVSAFLLFLSAHVAYSQTYAKNGMVVSAHATASQVGVDILQKGGNAIDASVATAFALAVVYPLAGNIGGGGFLVYMDAQKNATTTIDFREKAPLAAHSKMFLDENGDLIKGSNHNGLLSAGVPGSVAGLYMAHQKYGKLPWASLVQPAIDLAEKGYPLSWNLHNHAVEMYAEEKTDHIMPSLYKNESGEIVAWGELWKQPALAKTLTAIRDKGQDGFYKGAVAKEIARYMKENGGIITMKDLEKYEAVERAPIKGTYKGFDIYSMPPTSSGGVALIEMMNVMELAGLDSIEFNSAAYVHIVAEAMRRAFADRAEYLGDPDFNPDMPLDRLTSKEFAQMRYDNIDLTKASVSDSSQFGQLYDGHNTTHFSVIDKDGNAVSLTTTLEYLYGSKMGSPKLGFLFNNEMGDFNPIPGYTDTGWLIGTQPNQIQPEKRMLSSMTPTIVSKDGKPYLVIGSPGGRTIINTVFQTVLNVLEYDMRIDKAIEAMKIHQQWMPDKIYYEEDLMSPDTRDILIQMGHTVEARENFGRLMGITVDPKEGYYVGAADSSGPDAAAVGY
ncbi:gamma-glutamyltransferase [Reichenbachiella agarivorans]|uniref:Glutathione hydrolase proenzyme n=1 Tax=Reichenbachiella agarivorans TaxID=2979464 RepID=A0ABY6CJA4_9BACT|nr:gamma-glutamyltransferase [Reichenbachiella agarivorans]UXP30601.1 gamma-glutamyltransferase [Reichenbachiella agarivorans]